MFEDPVNNDDYYDTIDLRGTKFDKNYNDYGSEHWECLEIDVDTLKLNPDIHISSGKLYRIIKNSLPKLEKLLSPREVKSYIEQSEENLKFDRDGDLIKLYNIIKEKTNLYGRYKFFKTIVDSINFKDTDLGVIPKNLFQIIGFENCEFDNTIIGTDIGSLTSLEKPSYNNSNYSSIILPSVTAQSWKDKKGNRIGRTPITFRTNLYLELGRACNGNCVFCRNKSFDECKYDLENIKESFLAIYPNLDDIVIGGGEPTLRLDHLKEFRSWVVQNCKDSYRKDFRIFTNGSLHREAMKELSENHFHRESDLNYWGYDFNISRHAVNEAENAKILGLNKSNVLDTDDLEWVSKNIRSTTLCATCFKGGLDSYEKIIEYIKYAQSLGFKNLLLSSLHKNISAGKNTIVEDDININPELFEEVQLYLKEFGFKSKTPIYSTGGYISTVLSNDSGFSVAFKDYITEKELEAWYTAVKRTFDLSLDPSGNVFADWHQTSTPVQKIKK